jgi:hypothetical protein
MKTKEKENVCICNRCERAYDKKALTRSLGKEAMPVVLNYCSAFCYTEYVILKQTVGC